MKKNRGGKRNRGRKIKNGKRRGEWAELVFMMRAVDEGLQVSKPWGESVSYDFVVEQARRFVRVQVKSTTFQEGAGYSCSLKDSKGPYRGNPFDFVAAYVIPEDVWYLVPAKKCRGQVSISLHPEMERAKYSAYKEAWHLLRGEKPGRVARIEACVEEWVPEVAADSLRMRLIECPFFVTGPAEVRPVASPRR